MAATPWLFPVKAIGLTETYNGNPSTGVYPAENAKAEDDQFATLTRGGNNEIYDAILRVANFPIAANLPVGSSVTGIEVRISRWAKPGDGYTSQAIDAVVRLALDSGRTNYRDINTNTDEAKTDQIGNNLASSATWPNTQATKAYATYGGDGNLWGASLTDSQLRSAALGLDFLIAGGGKGSATANVDSIQMRVHYAGVGVPEAVNATANPSKLAIAVAGRQPSRSSSSSSSPARRTMAITPRAPTVQTASSSNPGKGAIVLTGYAPVIEMTAAPVDASATPGTSALSLVGYAPTAEVMAEGISPWTPAQLPGLLRWLDASSASNVTVDPSSGTVKIMSVKDLAQNASVVAGSQRPDWVNVGGKTFIRFTPEQGLSFADPVASGTSMSAFFVLQAEGSQPQQLLLGNNNSLMMPIAASASATNVEVFRSVTAPVSIRTNGTVTPWTNRGQASAAVRDPVPYQLGWVNFQLQQNLMYFGQGPFSYYHRGLLGELLFAPSNIGTDDVQRIEGYLAHKWAMATRLPANHPYKNAAPTAGGETNVDALAEPGTGVVALSGLAPLVASTATSQTAPGSISITGHQPVIQNSAVAALGAGSVAVQGKAASTSSSALSEALRGILALTGYAPSASSTSGVSAYPATGSVNLSGAALTVQNSATAALGSGAISIQGKAANVSASASADALQGVLSLTGAAPSATATTGVTASPGTGNLSLTGNPVTAANDSTASAGPSSLTIVGLVPQTAATNSMTATPGTGSLSLTSRQPSVSSASSANAGSGTIQIIGNRPITGSTTSTVAQPGTGSIQFTGLRPTTQSSSAATPATGALTIARHQPASGSDCSANPGHGAVSVTGIQPLVLWTSNAQAEPGTGTLNLWGEQPQVISISTTVPITPTADRTWKALAESRAAKALAEARQLSSATEHRAATASPEPRHLAGKSETRNLAAEAEIRLAS